MKCAIFFLNIPTFLSLFLSVSPYLCWHSLLCWHKDERSCRQMWLWMSSCCSVTQLPLLLLSPWRQWLLSPQQMFLENKGRDRDCSFSPVSLHHPLLLMCRRTCLRWPLIRFPFFVSVIFQSRKGNLSSREAHIGGILLKPCSNKPGLVRSQSGHGHACIKMRLQ